MAEVKSRQQGAYIRMAIPVGPRSTDGEWPATHDVS
jgi:hypothetical protein